MSRQVEHGLQIGVARLLQLVLDPQRTWWSGIDHAAQLSARYGADRKRRGVKRGLPDFVVLFGGKLLGIEIKTSHGRATPDQVELREDWRHLGAMYEIARSLDEVQIILEMYGVPVLRKMNFGRTR